VIDHSRNDLDALTRRQDRRMNRWRRDLRDEVLAAFTRQTAARGRFDVLAYVLVRRDIDRIYRDAYARWPGDVDAPLGRIVQDDARSARALAWLREMQSVVRLLPRGVVRAIRGRHD
jgi:hypothetical protein